MRDGVSSRLGFSIDISGAKVRGRVVSKVMMIHTYYVDSHSAFIGPCNQAQYPWPLPFSCCWMRCRSCCFAAAAGSLGYGPPVSHPCSSALRSRPFSLSMGQDLDCN
jgi:hypothetical protein